MTACPIYLYCQYFAARTDNHPIFQARRRPSQAILLDRLTRALLVVRTERKVDGLHSAGEGRNASTAPSEVGHSTAPRGYASFQPLLPKDVLSFAARPPRLLGKVNVHRFDVVFSDP